MTCLGAGTVLWCVYIWDCEDSVSVVLPGWRTSAAVDGWYRYRRNGGLEVKDVGWIAWFVERGGWLNGLSKEKGDKIGWTRDIWTDNDSPKHPEQASMRLKRSEWRDRSRHCVLQSQRSWWSLLRTPILRPGIPEWIAWVKVPDPSFLNHGVDDPDNPDSTPISKPCLCHFTGLDMRIISR